MEPLIEPQLARYRPIVYPTVIQRFWNVTTFFLETHPAARRWLEQLPPVAPADAPSPTRMKDVAAALASRFGLSACGSMETEELADVVLHEAEQGLRFLVEARFGRCSTAAESRAALARFIDLTLASLFAGIMAAIFRRTRTTLAPEVPRLWSHFYLLAALFQRIGLHDVEIFDLYFMHPRSVQAVAGRRGVALADAQQQVFRYLERLAAGVEEQGAEIAQALKADPLANKRQAAPWMVTLLGEELLKKPRRTGAS